MNRTEKMLEDHVNEEYQRYDRLQKAVDLIRENHLAHVKSDLECLKLDTERIKSDMTWLKWISMTSVGSGIAAFVSNLLR